MENCSDKELIGLTIKRCASAFKELYMRYKIPIYNFILRYTGNREIAEDLLQETFIRIWYGAHTFDNKKGNFRVWLYKIALNTTRNEMSKKQYKHYFYELETIKNKKESSSEERPDRKFDNLELQNRIATALKRLPHLLREVVIMKNYQQLKFREISEITDTPEGTLKARYHRAVEKLREELKYPE